MATRQEWDAAIAEVAAVSHANRPYWRVMLAHDEARFIVVCLQPWDEYDLDQARFLTTSVYDEREAQRRADDANAMIPPYLRTVAHVRLLRRVHGLQEG